MAMTIIKLLPFNFSTRCEIWIVEESLVRLSQPSPSGHGSCKKLVLQLPLIFRLEKICFFLGKENLWFLHKNSRFTSEAFLVN
jgi:hypothetical protein